MPPSNASARPARAPISQLVVLCGSIAGLKPGPFGLASSVVVGTWNAVPTFAYADSHGSAAHSTPPAGLHFEKVRVPPAVSGG